MDEILRGLQKTELEILLMFDNFCRNHGLRYSLYSGTMLGAVRHKGFIPWDDDVDVCMERTEYNRFLELWERDHPEGYLATNKDKEPAFTQTYVKILKDHTTFLENKTECGKRHMGIFIDVFPLDRIPSGGIAKYRFLFDSMYYQLLCREYIPSQSSGLLKIGSWLLLKLTPPCLRSSKREKCLARIIRYRECSNLRLVGTEVFYTLKMEYAPDTISNTIELEFEGHKLMCSARWDEMLQILYGNYMQMPPEAERTWTHHPLLIDFTHNYEELEKSYET